jgi:hypothetical protein
VSDFSQKRYAVFPGLVESRNDGDEHFLTFGRLCELYSVLPEVCVNMSDESKWRGRDISHLTPLRPRSDGNYSIP